MSHQENSEHNTTGEGENEKGGFLSNIPWKYIIIGIIMVVIAFAVLQVVNAIGKIFQPIIDAFGNLGKAGANILNNCVPQADCTKIGNCSQCNNTQGCSCTPDQKTCQNVSGKNAGDGGWLSLSGGVGIGFIIYGLGTLFMGILPIIAGWKASPAVEKIAKAEGKDVKTVAKEMTSQSMAEVEKNKSEYTEKTGKELSPEATNLTAKSIAESRLADRSFKAAQKLPSTEDRAVMQQEAVQRYTEMQSEVVEETKNLPEEERTTVENATEENKPSFVEKFRQVSTQEFFYRNF
jgi:hypothetical protein